MKTSAKQLATGTFIALILLVGNVYATGTVVKVSSLEIAESSLQMENWMTDEAIWNSNSINIEEFVLETETDLVLEDWMTDAESWNLNINIVEEIETNLELEGWMTDDTTWNTVTKETELTVEPWMMDSNIWK